MTIKKGTSILEVVIATAMISMAVIAALSLTSKSQSQNTYARRSTEASKYATQVADWLRGERDNLGFTELSESITAGTYCLVSLPADITDLITGECSDTDLIDNVFKRSLLLSKNADTITATVKIDWEDTTTRSTIINVDLKKW
jgi:Tfp pilus assembly protein PilV